MLEAALLLKQHDAEALKAAVAQRLAVLGDVGAKAARTTGSGGDKQVVGHDVFGRDALVIAQMDQILDQVTDGKVGRVALATIAELFAKLQRGAVGHIHRIDVVAQPVERAGDQVVVRHRQATDQDRGVGALGSGKLARIGIDPVTLGAFQAQRLSLLGFKLSQLGIDIQPRIHRRCLLLTEDGELHPALLTNLHRFHLDLLTI